MRIVGNHLLQADLGLDAHVLDNCARNSIDFLAGGPGILVDSEYNISWEDLQLDPRAQTRHRPPSILDMTYVVEGT
jgi:hypothetical protein